jgi:Bacteriophage Mu, Gp27
MSERQTRGRQSKIEQLPDEIKAQLDAMLRDGHSQKAILEHINDQLETEGEEQLSYSSLNRYSTRMESIGKEIREAREVADVWVSRIGTKPSGDVSNLLIEMMRTQAFKFMVKFSEDPDATLEPEMLKDLALGVQRLESAALQTHKREKDIRSAFAAEAAKEMEAVASESGWSAETVKAAKNRILGIA